MPRPRGPLAVGQSRVGDAGAVVADEGGAVEPHPLVDRQTEQGDGEVGFMNVKRSNGTEAHTP